MEHFQKSMSTVPLLLMALRTTALKLSYKSPQLNGAMKKSPHRPSQMQAWTTQTPWPLTAVLLDWVSSMPCTRAKGSEWAVAPFWRGGKKLKHSYIKFELGKNVHKNKYCLCWCHVLRHFPSASRSTWIWNDLKTSEALGFFSLLPSWRSVFCPFSLHGCAV